MGRYPQLWAALLAACRGAETLVSQPSRPGNQRRRRASAADCSGVAEEAILTELDRHYPDHDVIAEESSTAFKPRPRWIVDPLDGAVNYRNGVPHYCVSIAFEGAGASDVSVVYHIPSDTVYTAVEGEGAYANGRPLSVSETASIADALVVTGFDPATLDAQDYRQFRTLVGETQGVRRFGSAAADLSMVAAGTFDAFFERVLSVWDTAAGTKIVEEAGGKVTRIERLDGDNSEMVLASNPQLHRDLVALVSSGTVSTG